MLNMSGRIFLLEVRISIESMVNTELQNTSMHPAQGSNLRSYKYVTDEFYRASFSLQS